MLPGTLIESDVNRNDDTLVAVKAGTLVDRLAQKLPDSETKTLWRTLSDFK